MSDILTTLIWLSTEAEQDFDSASEGRSVCELHKRGQTTNRLKYCEGRDYVARRALKNAGRDPQGERLRQFLSETERKNLAIKESPILSGPDWQAYADGALSMVKEIRNALDACHVLPKFVAKPIDRSMASTLLDK